MDANAANASLDDDYGDNHGPAAPETHYLAIFRDTTWAEELTQTGGIDRLPIPNTSAYWPDADSGQKSLATGVASDPSTAVWDYDGFAWALMDDPVAGNRWDGGEFDDPLSNDEVGTSIAVDDGALTISYELD